MAEALFRNMVGSRHTTSSAGTKVITPEDPDAEDEQIGDIPGTENLLNAMDEIGIDIRHQLRTQVTPALVASAGKVIVMAEEGTVPNYLAQAPNAVRWEVTDAKGRSLEDVRRIREDLYQRCKTLLEQLNSA